MDDQITAADTARPASPAVGGRSFVQRIAEVQVRNRAEAIDRAVNTALAVAPAASPPPITVPANILVPAAFPLPITLAEREPTFREVAERYFDDVVKIRYNADSVKSMKSVLNRHIYPVLAEMPIKQIVRKNIKELTTIVLNKPNPIFPGKVGCPARANDVYWFLHRFFNWCLDEEIVDSNPCHGMGAPARQHGRDRVLNDKEIRWFWWACQEERFPFGAIGRLLLLTGQRRGEITNAAKTEINREEGMLILPISSTKSRRAHLVPLSDLALETLASVPWIPGRPLLFSCDGKTPSKHSFQHANDRIHARMKAFCRDETLRDGRNTEEVDVPWFTFHDLRRTAATVMCRLGQPLEVVDKIMNHAGGRTGTGRTVNSVTRVYVKHEYLDERRVALQALADHVAKVVGS